MPKLLTIVVLLLIIGVFGYLILWPNFQELQAVQAEVSHKKAELKSLEEYFTSLEEIKQEIQGYPDTLAKINTVFPSDPGIPSLFLFLQKKASENGLVLKDIKGF